MFFNKSILHYAAMMEVFSYNKLDGISYEKLCINIPKSLGSRSSIQNLLNEGLDQKKLAHLNMYKGRNLSESDPEAIESEKDTEAIESSEKDTEAVES